MPKLSKRLIHKMGKTLKLNSDNLHYMQRKTIGTFLLIFLSVSFVIFVITTLILGIPLWWVFRLFPLSSTSLEFKFDVAINPEAPTSIGESVLVTILNASNQIPVEGAKVSLRKDGTHIFDYYTDANGQVLVEYVGEVTIIEISKTDFETVLEAIPHAPAKWVRDQYTSIVAGIISGVVASVATYMLQNKRKSQDKRTN